MKITVGRSNATCKEQRLLRIVSAACILLAAHAVAGTASSGFENQPGPPGAAQAAVSNDAPVPTKETSSWWRHIKVLAADEFQGRLTGTPGYRLAAEYVAQNLQRDGLQPAGVAGYFQDVDFELQSVETTNSQVHLTRPGGASVDIGDAVVLSTGVQQRKLVRAPLVFAGYGIHLPEAGYDDFAGLDVRGAVVVCIMGGPESLSSVQRAHAFAENLPRYLEKAGAVGILSITSPKNREVPWARQKAAGSQPGLFLVEKTLRRFQGPMFTASMDETRVDPLMVGTGHTFSELVALADAHKSLPHFRFEVRLEAHVETTVSRASAHNVIAELPGREPSLAGEAIVLSAHLDHLGTGKPDHGDGIFHGAMDNASGVASLLEIAHALRANNIEPRRSIVFLVACGEEKGLLGSRYFAAHPTRHAGHLIANINIDTFSPLYPLTSVVAFGAQESSLGEDVRAVTSAMGVGLAPDPFPDHLFFIRSDQYSFVRRGVPALMLAMIPRPGTPEQATFRNWFATRYHAQTDDASQPVDLVAADAYNRLIYRLAIRVADGAKPPAWNTDSFFARYAKSPLP